MARALADAAWAAAVVVVIWQLAPRAARIAAAWIARTSRFEGGTYGAPFRLAWWAAWPSALVAALAVGALAAWADWVFKPGAPATGLCTPIELATGSWLRWLCGSDDAPLGSRFAPGWWSLRAICWLAIALAIGLTRGPVAWRSQRGRLRLLAAAADPLHGRKSP